jgi:ubiquinone/menaquinone biosynthesis C-methylase UbiE
MRAEPATRLTTSFLAGAFAIALMAGVSPAQEEPAKKAAESPEAKEAEKPKAKEAEKAKGKRARPQRAGHDHDHEQDARTFMGRLIAQVMSYQGAEWLFRASRIEEEQPEQMLDALEIEEGMTVADVGAGAGYHAIRLSERVGPGGKVYATDIQPQMIAMLKRNVAAAKLKNVTPVICTATDPKLPPGEVDLILMVDVYHECSKPVETLKGLHKALKSGGRLVLVEFRAEDPGVPIKPEHKMTVDQARKEVETQGFAFQKLHDFLPWQHIIVFEKAGEPKPGGAEGEKPAGPKEGEKP